jgi:hypothetical protein
MSKFSKIPAATLVSAALVLSTGASFAAVGPTFTTAAPGHGMDITEFAGQMAAFNKQDVTDLIGAKTVSVIKYDTAWSAGNGPLKAARLLDEDSQPIGLLRAALKANPAAVKLLAEHKIAINDVVDIVSDGHGAVQLYVS